MKLTIRSMTQEERAFSYTQKPEILEISGCVGHLRGDMGANGNEFWTTWDDHAQGLKTDTLKNEFDSVVNLLRSDEQYGGLLKDRNAMKAYCKSQPDSAFQGNYTEEYAFRADTDQYAYMIRCNPVKGDYNFYIYVYEREMLNKVLQPEQNKIKVLVVEPGKKPYAKEIDPGLKSLQHEVGGYIQAVYPFEEPVAIICDEEGKLKGSQLNRALRDEEGQIYDIVAGTFLVAGLGAEDFCSLNEKQIEKYSEHFKTPELFLRLNGRMLVIPVEEKPSRDRQTDIDCHKKMEPKKAHKSEER